MGDRGTSHVTADWSPELLNKLRAQASQFLQTQLLSSNGKGSRSLQVEFQENIDQVREQCLGLLGTASATPLSDAVIRDMGKAVEMTARLALGMASQTDLLFLNMPAVDSSVAASGAEFEADRSGGYGGVGHGMMGQGRVGLVLCPSLVRINETKAGSRSSNVVRRGIIHLR